MPLSPAQQERQQRRRRTPAPDPEPAIASEDVPSTAGEIVAWIDAASGDERVARAEVAAEVNGQRSKPWASVTKATEALLG